MSKTNELVLSRSKAKVVFKEFLSGKADTIFTREYDKGLVLGSSENGKTVVKKVDNAQIKEAYKAAFPYVVEAVYEKGSTDPVEKHNYEDFLDELPHADFNEIRVRMEKMKEEADNVLVEAKK